MYSDSWCVLLFLYFFLIWFWNWICKRQDINFSLRSRSQSLYYFVVVVFCNKNHLRFPLLYQCYLHKNMYLYSTYVCKVYKNTGIIKVQSCLLSLCYSLSLYVCMCSQCQQNTHNIGYFYTFCSTWYQFIICRRSTEYTRVFFNKKRMIL